MVFSFLYSVYLCSGLANACFKPCDSVLHRKCLVRLIHFKYLNILDVGVMQAVEPVLMFPVNVLARFPLVKVLELQE